MFVRLVNGTFKKHLSDSFLWFPAPSGFPHTPGTDLVTTTKTATGQFRQQPSLYFQVYLDAPIVFVTLLYRQLEWCYSQIELFYLCEPIYNNMRQI